MKSFFIIPLLALMLTQTFSKVLIVVDYQANREYIMEFLCINRQKPELRCEGHCYLKDKLQKQEQAEKQADQQSQKQETGINLFCQELYTLTTFPSFRRLTIETYFTAGPAIKVPFSFFHPPRFQS